MATSEAVMGLIRSVMPTFRNNNDKVAFVVHASFVISGFVLTATGRPAFAHDALSSSTTQSFVGIEGWNEFDEEYAFVYKKPVKGSNNKVKKVLVKCLVMNDKLLVVAIAEDGEEPAHLQIKICHSFSFFSLCLLGYQGNETFLFVFLMFRVGSYTNESNEKGDYDAQFKNFGKLVTDLECEILYKLKPVFTTTKRSKSRYETIEEPRDDVGRLAPLGYQINTTLSGVYLTPLYVGTSTDFAYLRLPQLCVPPPYVPPVNPDLYAYGPTGFMHY